MSIFKYDKDADKILTCTLDMEGPVNKLGPDFVRGLQECLDKLEKEKDELKGVIFTSGKSTFFAGADLELLLQMRAEDAETIFEQSMATKNMFRRMEQMGIPLVAAINGAALGGGYEFTLACHHRIVLDTPKLKVGLPEAGLGLLPGAGGICRLTYLLGAETAVPFCMEGKQVKATEAVSMGLVHDIAKDPDELMAKAKAWLMDKPTSKQPWDDKGYKIPGGKMPSVGIGQLLAFAPVMMFKKTKGVYPAPAEILKVAHQVLNVDFDTALKAETRHFIKLATGKVAKNMVKTLFYGLNAINAGASRPKDVPKGEVKKLGILGAGMMGRGIAYQSARSGIEVVLKDVSKDAAEAGKAYSEKLLQGKPNKDEVLGRITATDDYADLKGCDLIIEAVFEDPKLKATVTQDAEKQLSAEGFFASNTSTLPITGLAEASAKPDKFIGIHFFSPVEKMPLIEIIVGEKTDDETLARAFDYAQQIRKTPIVVNDSRGFFTSRVIGTYIDEAMRLLTEGVHPVRLERLARMAGLPVGPLALSDEVSQKLSVSIAKTTPEGLASKSYEVARTLVEDYDRAGRAYGGGFYEYPEGGKKFLWPKLLELYYKPEYEISDIDIQERMLFRQTIETLKCVEEGVIRQVRDANIGSIFGIGFPASTGGVLQIVNSYGPDVFLERVNEFKERYGERWDAPLLLKKHAESGAAFE